MEMTKKINIKNYKLIYSPPRLGLLSVKSIRSHCNDNGNSAVGEPDIYNCTSGDEHANADLYDNCNNGYGNNCKYYTSMQSFTAACWTGYNAKNTDKAAGDTSIYGCRENGFSAAHTCRSNGFSTRSAVQYCSYHGTHADVDSP